MNKEPRFPGVEWYCDHCGALLNSQKDFDDHKYTWKCRECGYKNSISWDNISAGDSKATQFMLHFLGFLSYIGFWTTIMLAVSLFVFHAPKEIYLIPFLISLGFYIVIFVTSVIAEFVLRRTKANARNVIFVIFRNLAEDLFSPLFMLWELLGSLLCCIMKLMPFKKKPQRKSNPSIIVVAILYLLIFAAEVLVCAKINHFI